MAIEIQEKFEIEAPTDRVWQFISTPELVVGCLPGASLAEVVDERNFLGRVKIKLGAVTAAYKGKIHFEDVDAERYMLVMMGEGKDPSGHAVLVGMYVLVLSVTLAIFSCINFKVQYNRPIKSLRCSGPGLN